MIGRIRRSNESRPMRFAALSTTGYGAVTPMPRQTDVLKALSRA